MARDRLPRDGGGARRGASTPTRTTSSTSAAARIATSGCARWTSSSTKRDALHAAAARGAIVLGVCGGFQLLGHRYELGDDEIPGLGLVDLETIRSPDGSRLIGNVAIEVRLDEDGPPRVLAGFENHGGRTHLGAGEQPLGRVLKGHGNTGSSGFEGVRRGSVIGTYLHGPLLPKNAWFADWLIRARDRPRRARAARRRARGRRPRVGPPRRARGWLGTAVGAGASSSRQAIDEAPCGV